MSGREINQEIPLFGEGGNLAEPFWAREDFLRYERNAVPLLSRRGSPFKTLKDWDRYYILSDQAALMLMVADMGRFCQLQALLIDFKGGRKYSHREQVVFPLARLELPSSSREGNVRVQRQDTYFDFSLLDQGGRILKVDIPSYDGGDGLRGALVLSPVGAPDSDVETLATLRHWKKRSNAFLYNLKNPSFDVEGVISCAGKDFVFVKDKAFAVLDWTRGLWPKQTSWRWLLAMGNIGGQRLALNFMQGPEGSKGMGENAIFIDGIIQKIGPVNFEISSDDPLFPWRIFDNNQTLDILIEPYYLHSAKEKGILRSSKENLVFANVSGSFILDSGEKTDFVNLQGMSEFAKKRW